MARIKRTGTRIPGAAAPALAGRGAAAQKVAALRKLAPLLAAAQRGKRGRRPMRRVARRAAR